MEKVTTIAAWRALRASWSAEDGIGFVPTMGYLHKGHLALVEQARRENGYVAVSIFVNPLQFGPQEDLDAYPRSLTRDLAMLTEAGVNAVFVPTAKTMYPAGYTTTVAAAGPLVTRLEGARRPGHFAGVASVVTKLFNIITPTRAYFGQKDAQQLAVVRRLVADLDLPITIVAGPIIREADGLAMSSRNVYLYAEERKAALVLRRALEAGRHAIDHGERRAESIRNTMRAVVEREPLATLDYVDVVHPESFVAMNKVTAPALLPIVVRIGKPRLLDNYLWHADGSWEIGQEVQS